MNTRFLTGAMLVSAFALTACGTKTETTSNTTTTNVAAPAPAATAPAAEGNTTAAAGASQQDFTILNKTGHTVVSLNVAPNNEDDWGEDVLAQDVLNNGESAKITFERGATECMWDLKATYDDNDTTEMKKVNLCEIGEVTLTAS